MRRVVLGERRGAAGKGDVKFEDDLRARSMLDRLGVSLRTRMGEMGSLNAAQHLCKGGVEHA
jgi:hypothetical protein